MTWERGRSSIRTSSPSRDASQLEVLRALLGVLEIILAEPVHERRRRRAAESLDVLQAEDPAQRDAAHGWLDPRRELPERCPSR